MSLYQVNYSIHPREGRYVVRRVSYYTEARIDRVDLAPAFVTSGEAVAFLEALFEKLVAL